MQVSIYIYKPSLLSLPVLAMFLCPCAQLILAFLQVSKYEKFGYGCMVTQLASTVAGIAELNHCGKI